MVYRAAIVPVFGSVSPCWSAESWYKPAPVCLVDKAQCSPSHMTGSAEKLNSPSRVTIGNVPHGVHRRTEASRRCVCNQRRTRHTYESRRSAYVSTFSRHGGAKLVSLDPRLDELDRPSRPENPDSRLDNVDHGVKMICCSLRGEVGGRKLHGGMNRSRTHCQGRTRRPPLDSYARGTGGPNKTNILRGRSRLPNVGLNGVS